MAKNDMFRINNHPLIKEFDVNTVGTDYFVGDIHGTFKQLKQALKAIGFDGNKDRLFSCGDLVDRGGSHRDMLDIIDKDWFHSCLGNHDDILLRAFEMIDKMLEDAVIDDNTMLTTKGRTVDENGMYVYKDETMYLEDFIKLNIAFGEREFLQEFDLVEMYQLVDYIKSLPMMMRVKTEHGDIGMVHAEIPKGKTFQETIDWMKEKEKDDVENKIAREYLFWGERGKYIPENTGMLFSSIFDIARTQEEVDVVVNETAQDLHLLYMGHNIMPIKAEPYHGDDIQRRLNFDTGHLVFSDHGSFIADQIETDAYGLGIYNNKGEMLFFIDSEPL